MSFIYWQLELICLSIHFLFQYPEIDDEFRTFGFPGLVASKYSSEESSSERFVTAKLFAIYSSIFSIENII